MPRVQIILETPALVRVGLPIIAVAAYDIEREINAAGAWAIEFPAGEALASQVRSRWRVSVIEDGRPGYLLRRGIITDRQFSASREGGGILRLAGFSRLFGLANQSTHVGLRFAGVPILEMASTLAGEAVIGPTVPEVETRQPTVTFNDTSKLSALLTALEYARVSIRETFDEDGFELVAWDDVPDSGFRFVTVAQAGPDLDGAAAAGLGLIAGTPRIGYNGRDLATRVIPIGTDYDGNPLTLEFSTKSLPYEIKHGVNPDGSAFHYLEDANAIAASELIELPLVRSDIKNPNQDPISRGVAADALYAVGAGILIQRKSDVIAFASEIANGAQVDALPGSRVRILFRGRAASFGGAGNYWSLDQDFLIAKRRDASTAGGVRGVSFTLTAPEVPMRIPSLPDAVVIPPSPQTPPDPPDPSTRDPGRTAAEEEDDDALDLEDVPEVPALTIGDPILPEAIPFEDLVPPKRDRGAYQNCCPDTTTENEGGNVPPPEDIEDEDDDGVIVPPGDLHWLETWSGGPTGPEAVHFAGFARSTNGPPTVSDCTLTALGEVSLTHGGSLDNSPPATIYFWGVRVTGPNPIITGANEVSLWKASGSLEDVGVNWTLVTDVAEESHPFPGGGSFDLNVSLATPSLPNNKSVAIADFGNASIYNQFDGSSAGGYGDLGVGDKVGPQSVTPYTGQTSWTPDNTFPPYVCMWVWVAQCMMGIAS